MTDPELPLPDPEASLPEPDARDASSDDAELSPTSADVEVGGTDEASEGVTEKAPRGAIDGGSIEASGGARCPNCAAPLTGPWCAACGQRQVELEQPVRHFLTEALGGLFSWDTRLWRTLRTLFRPGVLTRDYLEGRRARYVPPARLYLFTSFAAFLVLGFVWSRMDLSEARGMIRITSNEEGVEVPLGEEDVPEFTDEELAEMSPQVRWLVTEVALPVAEQPRRAYGELQRRLPIGFLFLVPVLAFLLWLVYRRRERYYVPHLVASLHIHTMGLIAISGGALFDLMTSTEWPSAILLLALLYWCHRTLRVLYRGRRWTTALLTPALAFVYSILSVPVLLVMLVLAGLAIA